MFRDGEHWVCHIEDSVHLAVHDNGAVRICLAQLPGTLAGNPRQSHLRAWSFQPGELRQWAIADQDGKIGWATSLASGHAIAISPFHPPPNEEEHTLIVALCAARVAAMLWPEGWAYAEPMLRDGLEPIEVVTAPGVPPEA